MKTNLSKFLALAVWLLAPLVGLCRDVTLTVGGAGLTEVAIGTNETAQIASWFPLNGNSSNMKLEIVKDGLTMTLYSTIGFSTAGGTPPRIAGPATIRLAGDSSNPRGFCTVQIDPASFPPDKTLVVPAGTAGANIILESSTDLVQWTTAAPGAYTNLQSNMFFRIRADRLP